MGQGRVLVAGLLGCWVAGACSRTTSVPIVQQPAPVVTPVEAPPADPVAVAKEGLAAFDAKQYDVAVAKLTAASASLRELAPFLRLRVMEAELARGNPESAAAAATEIIALGGTSATTVARLRLPAIYAQLGNRGATDAAWELANAIPIDELTEEGFVVLANALASAGREDLATKTRMRLLNDYTGGRYTEQTYGKLRAEIAKLPKDASIALAQKLARADRYDQALEILNRIGNADDARATRIRALFNSRHYAELLDETKDMKLTDPALALLRARAAWREDRQPEFLAALDAIDKDFPSSKEAIEAKVLRAKYYTTDEIDYPRSLDNLKKAIDAGALGADGENLWNLGYTYVLAGMPQEALQAFDRYIAAYPDGDWKTNSLFWSAKILDRAGRTAERDAKARQVASEYPFSYYTYRAKELWGIGDEGIGERGEAFPNLDTEFTRMPEPRFGLVRALLAIGLPRDATREMKVLAAQYPESAATQFMLADVYVQGGEPLKANGVLQRKFRQFVRHGGSNIPQRFWEILFPLPYWDAIRAEAERRGLDPYLVASIIRQESAFEPATVSNAGAVGLMQIMPEEASRIAAAGALGEITRESLFDPATNIAVGATEYSQKLAAWNGNHTLAIASYNAGEEPVRGWLARTPVDDIDLFIESIPFAETRLYVKTVNRNRNEYRRIYEQMKRF